MNRLTRSASIQQQQGKTGTSTANAQPESVRTQYSWIADGEGYPVEFFESISKPEKIAYECGICLQIARDAVECKHHHLFCQLCIKKWFSTSSASKKNSCPVCQNASEFPASKNVNLKIACKTVHCPCCSWKGYAEDLTRHYRVCSLPSLKRAASITDQNAAKKIRVI
jgi:hypothetical protein